MDKATSNETGASGNMVDFPSSKEERIITQIIVTKFHTEPATDSKMETRLNLVRRDMIINRPTIKKKQNKQQKKETIAEMTKSVGENQPVWLDTL